MKGIFSGVSLAIGAPGSNTFEAVTVSSVTLTTFTATFANNHSSSELVSGCTFPSGQTDNPIWTQAEVIGYLLDVQMDFLLKVRPVYATGSVSISSGNVVAAPSDSIRIERASLQSGVSAELYNVEQADLDWQNSLWNTAPGTLKYWYQDAIANQSIGFGPSPSVNTQVFLLYSQKCSLTQILTTPIFVPDPMSVALKWGVLARCLSKDGEQRDPQRAKFAQQMFDMCVVICAKFMSGVTARLRQDEETVEPLASQRL
jgi:hypothetical protein